MMLCGVFLVADLRIVGCFVTQRKKDKRNHTKNQSGVQILDPVNDKNVYIVQSLEPPVNDNLMELLLLVAAAKRSGCKNVTAVIPYLGYSRDIRPEAPGNAVPYVGSSVARLVRFFLLFFFRTAAGPETKPLK